MEVLKTLLKISLKLVLSLLSTAVILFFIMIAFTTLMFGGFWVFFALLSLGIVIIFYIIYDELF